jgi:integration host factor subunit alpha
MIIKKNLTKIHIAKELSQIKGFPIILSKKLIDDFIKILTIGIKKNNFNLKNIGTFKIINKKERAGRNPKTSQIFIINARKAISFKPSKTLVKNSNE